MGAASTSIDSIAGLSAHALIWYSHGHIMTGTAGVTYEIRGAETQAVCRQTQTNHMQAFIRIHTKHKEMPLPVHPLNEHICGHLCACLCKMCSDVTASWEEGVLKQLVSLSEGLFVKNSGKNLSTFIEWSERGHCCRERLRRAELSGGEAGVPGKERSSRQWLKQMEGVGRTEDLRVCCLT